MICPARLGLANCDLLKLGAIHRQACHANAAFDVPQTLLAAQTLCYDLSYGKAAKVFLDGARKSGATRLSDGLGMLVEQAAESFFLWHGQRPDTASVYAELRAPAG